MYFFIISLAFQQHFFLHYTTRLYFYFLSNIVQMSVFLYYFSDLLATYFFLRFFIVVLLCTIVFLFSIVFVANVVNKVCRVLKIFFIKNDDRTKKSDATSCQDMRFVEKDISKIELQLALYAISSEIVIMHQQRGAAASGILRSLVIEASKMFSLETTLQQSIMHYSHFSIRMNDVWLAPAVFFLRM